MKLILAPMAGVSCAAFRLASQKHGANHTYTPMIDAEEYISSKKLIFERLSEEKNLTVQLIGSKKENLKALTEEIEDYADEIDINLACPLKENLGKRQGAFFLKHPEQIERLISGISSATNKPITAKIRSGWDKVNAPEVSKILEDLGIAKIAIHARTKQQLYTGKADWNIIKKVKETVNIPIIGNGDITNLEKAKQMQKQTGCDAVMIGRAAKGNPLIFQNNPNPTAKERINALKEFITLYEKQKRQSETELKAHALWFLKGNKQLQNKIKCMNTKYIKNLIKKDQ